ncbi:alpha/beta hydrolase [uncultured Holdemanella sp.]|uniref:alpha/beta hydrolase n=1 Tax=uncultured Holdemanella sp. TaxID=1763549 RepID=UPI0025FA0128|nr:alpha/beta hydrolase [uncultured Holdemanella sp.]
MEIKEWTYEEYPSFDEEIEGVKRIYTSGNEMGTYIYSNVEYKEIDGVTLHLQIITPYFRNMQNTKYPCLVYVQGSAWLKQNINKALGLLSRLAEKGYVIAVVEYRHSGIAPFPAVALDTRSAIEFMKKHSEEYMVDTDKMFVGGNSSGAHAALFSQIIQDEQDADVKGILSLYGANSVMFDDGMPSTINHHLPDSPEGKEMGGVNLRERKDLCEKMSVECNIDENTKLPPVLMFHGTKDRTINPKVSVAVYKKLKQCGIDVQLYMLEGADHGGSEFWTEEIQQIIIHFLKNLEK